MPLSNEGSRRTERQICEWNTVITTDLARLVVLSPRRSSHHLSHQRNKSIDGGGRPRLQDVFLRKLYANGKLLRGSPFTMDLECFTEGATRRINWRRFPPTLED
eukprot:920534-Prorocentrum_minimum.AAC.5